MTSLKIAESLQAQGIQARLTAKGTIAATAQNGDLSASQIAFLRENKPKIVAFLYSLHDKPEQKTGRHYPPSAKIDRLRAALEYFIMDFGIRFYIDTGGLCQAEISPEACASLTQDQADAIDDLCLYHGELAARARVLRTGGAGMDCVSLTF